MKAIVYERYGPPTVLQIKEIEKPVPKDNEVLIDVDAASVNSRDWRLMRANPFFVRFMVGGLLKPKISILGADVAGRVERVGNNVTQFRPGDEVFGLLYRYESGTFAEFVCAAEDSIALKPANLSFEQAAAVPLAALTALQGLRKGNIQPENKVLIQGASGGVGTFAVQLAKVFGAEVTAVCSTSNLDLVCSLGADHIIDYKKEDFTRNRQQYDLILAVNGYHPLSHYLQALTPEGSYVVAGGSMRQLFRAMGQSRRTTKTAGRKTYVLSTKQSKTDLLFMKELLEANKVTPVIDRCYPMSEVVEAFRYFEEVHAKGKIVITMAQNN